MNISDICELKYNDANIEPESDDVIVSCSIFRIESMYRDIYVYTNGLASLIKFLSDENNYRKTQKYFLFVYYDHSVKDDIEFKKILDMAHDNKKIKLCEYNCPSFIDPSNGLYRGLFGTFIRSLPLYDPKYEANIKTVTDIDFTRVNHLYYIRENIKRFTIANCDILVLVRIGYGYRYCNYFNNESLGDAAKFLMYLKNIYLPIDLMVTFLKMLISDENNKFKQVLDNLIKTKANENDKKCESTLPIDRYVGYKDMFVYGIDEYYANKILLPYIFEKKQKYGVIYSTDYFPDYVNTIINYDESDNNTVKYIMKEIIGNKFNENGNFDEWKIQLADVLLLPTINNTYDYYEFLKLIKKFYYLLKENSDNEKITVNNEWLRRLRKHVNRKLVISEYMRGKYLHSNALKVVLANYQIYIHDFNDKSNRENQRKNRINTHHKRKYFKK